MPFAIPIPTLSLTGRIDTSIRKRIARLAAAVRYRRSLRALAELPPHLQADVGFVGHFPPPPPDTRTFDRGLQGTYW